MTAGYAAPMPDAFQMPDDLSELDRWVLWRLEQVRGRDTKVPYSVRGHRASSTDPRHWAPYDDALAAWRRNPQQRYAGIGFVFLKTDGLCGVDLDDCLGAQGVVKPWAQGIVERFGDSYMEISPSGTGIKIWARGSLPSNLPGAKVSDGQIEMYDHSRFFAVTGRAFLSAPLQVEDHAGDLLLLYERLRGCRRSWALQPLEGGRIPYGQQHNTLVSIVGTLRARRICDEAIEACILAINQHQCERPGEPENIIRMVGSTRPWGAR